MDLTQILALQPCAVVAHTLGVDPSILSVILAQAGKTTLQDAYVVTWNTETAKADIGSKPAVTKKVTVLSYEDFLSFKPITRSVIVFDSINHLVALIGVKRLQDLIRANNIVLLLYSILSDLSFLQQIREAVPGASLLSASFADLGQDIQFELHETKMTPAQDLEWQLHRNAEIKDQPTYIVDGFVKSLQYENLIYPHEIQVMLDADLKKLGRSKDLPWPNTIVDRYRDQMLENAPKLRDLIVSLMLNRERRHVVFTRYTHYYGLDVIVPLLQLYKFKIYSMSGEQTPAERLAVIAEMNNQPGGCVLVTSVVFPGIGPRDISHIHMLDGALSNSDSLLAACYKYANYAITSSKSKEAPRIVIDYYVCQRYSGADAGGAVLYQAETERWKPRIEYWNKAVQTAKPIILAEEGRFTVHE